jgi:HD domain
MEVDKFCHGHGLTRAGFIGRGAIAGGALLGGSAGLAGAAKADDGDDGHRHVPEPFEVPNTPLARAVANFAAGAYPAFLRNHCQRSYDVATLIAAAGKMSVDLEVLYAAILLHDLGLTPRLHSSSARFEVASADAARSFAREHGLSPMRADAVWDAVVLHGTGGIARFKSLETFVVADGIGRDVTGLDLDEFPKDVVDRIMATRPGFAQPFIDAIVADLQDKPQVANGTWMMLIAIAHIPSFQPVSVETLAFNDPYEQAR